MSEAPGERGAEGKPFEGSEQHLRKRAEAWFAHNAAEGSEHKLLAA